MMLRHVDRLLRLLVTAAIAVTIGAVPIARAQLKAGAIAGHEMDGVVTLVSIDRMSRTAVLRGGDDIALNVTVPPEVRAFERAKPGDRFSLHYVSRQSLALNKGGAAGVSETESSEFAIAGDTPIGRFTATRSVTLRVQQVNRANRTLTIQDANNR
ncbi:MAG: hypothetical protein ACXW2I_20215, partial [Burkholderiales bacterium]